MSNQKIKNSKIKTNQNSQYDLPKSLIKKQAIFSQEEYKRIENQLIKARKTPSFYRKQNFTSNNTDESLINEKIQQNDQKFYEEFQSKTIDQLKDQNQFLKIQLSQLKDIHQSVLRSLNNTVISNQKSNKKTGRQLKQSPSKKTPSPKKIQQSEDQQPFQLLDKKYRNYKKTIKELKDQYNDYEYMFSGEYKQRVIHQIQFIKNKIIRVRKQIGRVKNQLSKPMQIQSEIYQKYDRQIYDLQVNIKQFQSKNNQKLQKLKKIQEKNKQKLKGKQIIQQFLDEYDLQSIQKQQNRIIQFQSLKEKKFKLMNIVNSQQKNNIAKALKKQQQVTKVLEVSQEISKHIQDIVQLIQEKKIQLNKLKTKVEKNRKLKGRVKTQASLMPIVNEISLAQSKNNPALIHRRRIYTQLQNNNYFKSNQVLKRQRQWLNSICDSRFENLQIDKLQLMQDNHNKNINKIRLPSIGSDSIMITNPLQRVQHFKKRRTEKIGQIVAVNRQQNSFNDKYNSTKSQSYNNICKLLKKNQLDLQEDYNVSDLLYD